MLPDNRFSGHYRDFFVTALPCPVMQLLQHILHLIRNRQAEMRGIFQNAQAIVREEKENDRCAQHTGLMENLLVENVGQPNQQKN